MDKQFFFNCSMNRLINADYVFLEIFVWMEKPYFSLCMKSFFFCNCSWIRTPIRPLFGNNGSSPLVRPPLSAMKKWPAKRGNLSWLEWHNYLVVIYYLRRVASLDGDNLVVIYYLRRVASLEWHNLVVIYYLRKVAFCGSCLIRGWLLYSNFLLFVVAKIYSSFKTLCSRIFDILLNLDFLSHWIISIFSFHLLNFYNACH